MRKNKYFNVKTEIDGIKFDSKKEAYYYLELKLAEKSGFAKNLKLQPVFLLQDGYMYNGKKIRPITYRADFSYTDPNGDTVVVDVKGVKTKEYLLKKKIFLKLNPNIIFEEA